MSAKDTKSNKESSLRKELKDYQNKTFQLYIKEGAKPPRDIIHQKMHVDDFLRRVKEDKQPIQKIITYMKRIPKVVRDPNTGKAEKKDFLEVHSELRGYDWKNNLLRVTDYYDGWHYEPELHTTTKGRDDVTGDLILDKQHQGNTKVYDIELTDKNRKDVISSIINAATGSFTDEIIFYYEVPDSIKGGAHRDGSYSYSEFINSSPEEMENLTWSKPPILHASKDKKSYMG